MGCKQIIFQLVTIQSQLHGKIRACHFDKVNEFKAWTKIKFRAKN